MVGCWHKTQSANTKENSMAEFGRWVYWIAIALAVINFIIPTKWCGENPTEFTRAMATIGLTLMIVGLVAVFVGASAP